MNKKILLLGLACGACCTIPLLMIPTIAGFSVFGVSFASLPVSLDTIICTALLAIMVAFSLYFLIRRLQKQTGMCQQASCQQDGSCGCKPFGKK